MIVTLHGIVSEKLPDLIVIDVNGIGYGLYVSNDDYVYLNIGQEVKVYVYEHIREQAYELFGFTKIESKKLFDKLLDVNGVGPKMALNVLSIGSTEKIRTAIAEGDTKIIQQASGVGKRLAERLVVELRDKVGLISNDLASSGILTSQIDADHDEALSALVSLGYSMNDAIRALQGIDQNLKTEERIKQALVNKF